jgi:hypothetical protein
MGKGLIRKFEQEEEGGSAAIRKKEGVENFRLVEDRNLDSY